MKCFRRSVSSVLIALSFVTTFAPAVTEQVLAAARGDVVITAFMADPVAVSDQFGEWLQITNITDQEIDLSGWKITDEDRQEHIFHKEQKDATGKVTSLPIPFPAQATLTLCRDGDSGKNGGVTCDYTYGSDIQLKNDGTTLVLLDNGRNRREVERVVYSNYWIVPGSVTKFIGRPDRDDNANYTFWKIEAVKTAAAPVAAVPAVTPTPATTPTTPVKAEPVKVVKKVSPYPQIAKSGDVIVTEFMADPTDVSDDRGEWIELYNKTNQTLNLDGWTLSDGDRDDHQIDVADGILAIESGAYVTLCRNGDYLLNGGVACNYSYGSSFQMKNDGDQILLKDKAGTLIENLAYANYWVTPGQSAALKDVNVRDAASYPHWTKEIKVALDSQGTDKGTPGRPNQKTEVVISIEPINLVQLTVALPEGVTVLGKSGFKVGKTNENFGESMEISSVIDAPLQNFAASGQSLKIMGWNSQTRTWEVVGSEKDIQGNRLSIHLSHATILTFVSTDPLASYLFESGGAATTPEEEIKEVVTETAAKVFKDVSPAFWAYDYIRALQNADVIEGYSDNTFRPHNFINRAEMAKVALKAFGQKPHVGMESRFKDVPANAWYTPFVQKAELLGVIQAKNGYFHPENRVTRAEALALLLRASRLKLDTATTDVLKTDISPNDWVYGYVRFAEAKGFIDTAAGHFFANKPANRATVAAMAAKILDYVQNADDSEFFVSYAEMKNATTEKSS